MRRVRSPRTAHRRGEQHPRARISDEDVHLMRRLHAEGLGYGAIAAKFSEEDEQISRYTVRNYCRGLSR